MPFVRGLELNAGFFADIVQPLLATRFPALRYAAGLLGHCSDVLGFDDETSSDHVWGPRMQVFLAPADHAALAAGMDEVLARQLPATYRGYPTHYQAEPGWFRWARLEPRSEPPYNHFIEIVTVQEFFNRDIEWSTCAPPTIEQWLSFTDQALVELTSGQVWRDDLGELTRARQDLAYWPAPVWLFRMWCLWNGLEEEKAFVGRCWQVGDEAGARLIAARMSNRMVKLCFLLERRYFPYSKWIGSALRGLACYSEVAPPLRQVLVGEDYRAVEEAMCELMRKVACMHNALRVTEPIEVRISGYHGRAFRVLEIEPICAALRKRLEASPLRGHDWGLLSKVVLYDESNFGSSARENRRIVAAARPG